MTNAAHDPGAAAAEFGKFLERADGLLQAHRARP
jgi:hypothetical protein